jgi:trehalose 6-phosphate phosphatase
MMRYLFSAQGEAALRALAPEQTLYAFDFDGTLAPIVTRPDAARAPAAVLRRLERLAARQPVAVISGRARADVAARVPANVAFVIGNHGNEGLDDAPAHEAHARAVVAGWRRQLPALLDADADAVLIEDKGVSVAVHYRLARRRAAVAERLAQLLPRLQPPPRVVGGKMVFNLLAPAARTKFEALATLAQRCGRARVFFIGDDDTDELVFAQAPAPWFTVRVEYQHGSRAAFFLHRQAEVVLVLERLVRRLEPARTTTRSPPR